MRVDREFVFAAVTDERHRLANLLEGLDAAQLATPSLCAGWDVQTVAAHVVSTVVDGTPAFLRLALRRRSMARAIDELARRRARLPAAEIAASLHRCADRRISPPLFGPLDPLADVLVHGGDVKIPLGLPFQPDPQLAALAMDFLTVLGRLALFLWAACEGLACGLTMFAESGEAARRSLDRWPA